MPGTKPGSWYQVGIRQDRARKLETQQLLKKRELNIRNRLEAPGGYKGQREALQLKKKEKVVKKVVTRDT